MSKLDEKKANYWEEKVNEYKKSGGRISQSKWCKENDLSLRKFNYWYCKFKGNDVKNKENGSSTCSEKVANVNPNNKTKWIPIEIEEEEKDEDENENKTGIIVNMGKAKIEVVKGFDEKSLFEVLKVVNLLC